MTVRIIIGDCREELSRLPDGSVHCCVTSPPYFGLRDYGVDGQMGLEPTPDEFVAGMVAVFREVRRVLRDDGTLWLNIGDSYCASPPGNKPGTMKSCSGLNNTAANLEKRRENMRDNSRLPGIKQKDLIGIPWMLAFALRADGWYLRQEIIWSKPNPMPESVRDRCTKAHEQVFLLSKKPRYYFDAEAIKEEATWRRENNPEWAAQRAETNARKGCGNRNAQSVGFTGWSADQGRNKRSVWTVSTVPFGYEMCTACEAIYSAQEHSELRSEKIVKDGKVTGRRVFCRCGEHAAWLSHFATFPPELIEPCILAGCPKGGTILDPFGGAGTTGLVADRLQRNAVLIELNPKYAKLARRRIDGDRGGLLDQMEAAE